MDRKKMRAWMKKERSRLPLRKRLDWSVRACDRLCAIEEFQEASSVFVFLSFGSEIVTDGIIEAGLNGGKKVYVPLVVGSEMIGARITSEHYGSRFEKPLWTENKYGIAEPAVYGEKISGADDADIVVAPGLVFDMRGYRIGYGGGFYDKFLEGRKKSFAAGLCFEMQITDKVPNQSHDEKLDAVVTENEVYRVR